MPEPTASTGTASTGQMPAVAAKPASKQPFRIRTAIPYLIVALLAAAMLGWYFFVYVPAQLQYFVNVRFRLVAVAAAQFKSKVDSLSAAVNSADRQTNDARHYLELLVPELHVAATDTRASSDRASQLDGIEIRGDTTSGRVVWADVLRDASSATRRDFDDLVLADQQGRVVWQREETTPRIGNLAEVIEAATAEDTSSFTSFRWSIHTTVVKPIASPRMPAAATARFVNLDGTTNLLVVQPITVIANRSTATPESTAYFLAGIASRAGLQRQATHIPTEWVAAATLPFVLVFLALPFLKLGTVTRTERYRFIDVAGLGIALVLITAIAGAMPFAALPKLSHTDGVLETLASRIDRNLADDAKRFLDFSDVINENKDAIGQRLRPCAVRDMTYGKSRTSIGQAQCDFWTAYAAALGDRAKTKGVPPGFADLDVVAWVAPDAWQVEKWTTKLQVTTLIQDDYPHFRDVMAGRTWTLADDRTRMRPFTIEPLRSPTTSETAFVFATPLIGAQPGVLIVNVKPESLVAPLVPPGYGFAVVSPDGRVLFHSQGELSLEENFLQEITTKDLAREAMRSAAVATWTGDYHGRQHRFRLQHVTHILDCPWSVVTFSELEPLLDITAERQTIVLGLFLVDVLVIVAFVAVAIVWWKSHDCEIAAGLIASSGQLRRDDRVRLSIRLLAALLIAALLIVIGSYYTPLAFLGVLYAIFLLLPLGAVAVVIVTRRAGLPAARDTPATYTVLAVEIFLVAVLVGAIPAAGLARLVRRLDDLALLTQTLNESRQQYVVRSTAARGNLKASSNYTEAAKAYLLGENGFAAALPQQWPTDRRPSTAARYSYLDAVGIEFVASPRSLIADPTSPAKPLFERLVDGIRTGIGRGSITMMTPGFTLTDDRGRDAHPSVRLNDSWVLSAVNDRPGFDDLWSFSSLWAAVLLAMAFIGTTWARQRMSTRSLPADPTLEDLVEDFEAHASDAAILLVGVPRLKKDTFAAQTVTRLTKHPPVLRIRLLDAVVNHDWIAAQIRAIDQAVRAEHLGKAAWIHVSNFEAQLVDPLTRATAVQFLEALLKRRADGTRPPIAILMTSTIDPVAHFEEIFRDEQRAVYATPIPEIELNRSVLALSRLRRCYRPIDADTPWPLWLQYSPANWRATLAAETACDDLLGDARADVENAWTGVATVSKDDLRRAIREHADPCYQLLWTSCTRMEKLALVQLAQEGLVNPKSREVIQELIAKGLVIAGASPTPFNLTFRDFLREIEPDDVIQEWERMDGAGTWALASQLAASVLVIAGAFYLLTQGFGVQGVLPLLSGSGLISLPYVKDVIARVSSGGDKKVNG